MTPVALFTCASTPYRGLGLECYDEDRDARTYLGEAPVIAHPPCRLWGRLFRFSKAPRAERDLAFFAVDAVRRNGGVLEHPAYSMLWGEAALPLPGERRDEWGGWTLPICQSWFGHRAPKPTWLYIVGCEPKDLPLIPFHLGMVEGRIQNMGKAERERTPELLAEWLMLTAARCAR